jgi:deoxyribodipyrimidine photo-lyase
VLSKAPSLQAAAFIRATEYRSALDVSPKVLSFVDGALADTRCRLSGSLENVSEIARGGQAIDHVVEWTRQNGLRQLVTPYVPVGPTAEVVRLLVDKLGSQGIQLIPVLRSWDEGSWPHATHGFFKFREKIPKILREVNMADVS